MTGFDNLSPFLAIFEGFGNFFDGIAKTFGDIYANLVNFEVYLKVPVS